MRSQKMQDFIDDRLDAALSEKLESLTAADILEIEVVYYGRRMDIRDVLYDHFEERVVDELEAEYKDRIGT